MDFIAHQYRLQPTGTQSHLLRRFAGQCRWVYNTALQTREDVYKATGKGLGLADLGKRLTTWRAQHPWLRAGSCDTQQQALRDLLKAYTRWLDPNLPNRKPRKRTRRRWRPSMRFPNRKNAPIRVERLTGTHGQVRLPKVGWVRFRWSRTPAGNIRNATTKQDACGDWTLTLLCAVETDAPTPPVAEPVGVDLGVAHALTLSTGEHIDIPTPSRGDHCHLARLQRRLARRTKGSRGWRKTRRQIARWHRTHARRRKDAIEKVTDRLTREHSAIAIEDLKVANMTRGVKGRGRVAKAGLNRAILARGWSLFRRKLEEKGARRGVRVDAVSPAYTSQRCSSCGHTEAGNRPSQSRFCCTSCGHTLNADVNAALNVLLAGGYSAAACGGSVRPGEVTVDAAPIRAVPAKQEPNGSQLAFAL